MSSTPKTASSTLPRWSVADVHESFSARSFTDSMERAGAQVSRLEASFNEHNIRAIDPRPPTDFDGAVADSVIKQVNETVKEEVEEG